MSGVHIARQDRRCRVPPTPRAMHERRETSVQASASTYPQRPTGRRRRSSDNSLPLFGVCRSTWQSASERLDFAHMDSLIPAPVSRSLRIFTFDPSLAMQFDLAGIGEITITVPWEPSLSEGPAASTSR